MASVRSAPPIAQAGVDAPTALSAQWCIAQGLKDDAGSFTVLRSLDGANVALVSIGGDAQSVAGYRLAGASAARAAGEGSFAFFLPTEGLENPGAIAQAVVEGALLVSYAYKAREVTSRRRDRSRRHTAAARVGSRRGHPRRRARRAHRRGRQLGETSGRHSGQFAAAESSRERD